MGMINFDTLPNEKASQFTVIPKGSYIAKIVKAEMKTPKSGNNDYFSAECDITDPASGSSMGKFWINLYESQANLPLYQIKRFIQALNLRISGEFELKDLTKLVAGKSLVVDICPDEEGKRSIVDISADCFYPIESEARERADAEINEVFTAPMAAPVGPTSISVSAEPTPAVSASY